MNDVIMMSVGLYSNVWLRLKIISTEVLEGLTYKFGVESLALTETCLDIKFHIYWYYSYLVTCLQEEEEEEEKEENMDKMGKLFLGIIFIFGTFSLRFLVYSSVFTYLVPQN